jgi:formylglycine-generating enzyme required for sulfatase activity
VIWLSRKTGKTYRLLSEAEREYLTRAGTTTPFWWGSSISTQQANYDAAWTYPHGGPKGTSSQKTMPVDSFQPNPWGFYQVHGNIMEWTEDCFHANYNGAPIDGSAWTKNCFSKNAAFPPDQNHVNRGGGWRAYPVSLRSAGRHAFGDSACDNCGLRVARTLEF